MLGYLAILSEGIVWTLVVSGSSVLIGIVLGLPIALLRLSRIGVLSIIGRSIIELFRSVPPIVLLFIVFYGVGTDIVTLEPLTAAISTLGIVTAVYMAEAYRAGFLSLGAGQWEAAYAICLSRRDTLFEVILPQAVRVALPTMATISIGVLKDSALASTVGVRDITAIAVVETNQTLKGMEIYLVAAAIYIALSIPIAFLSRRLHSRLSAMVSR